MAASERYTPPIPRTKLSSPPWYGPLIIAVLALGGLVIILNYVGLLPGAASNGYLLVGLGLITVGFLLATRYR